MSAICQRLSEARSFSVRPSPLSGPAMGLAFVSGSMEALTSASPAATANMARVLGPVYAFGGLVDRAALSLSRLPRRRRKSLRQESAAIGWNCRNGNSEPASARAPRRRTFQLAPRKPGSPPFPSPRQPGPVAQFPGMTTAGIESDADRPRVEALCFSRSRGIQPAGRNPRHAVCAGATSTDRCPADRKQCRFAKTAR